MKRAGGAMGHVFCVTPDAMRAFHLFDGIVRSSVSELGAAKVGRADLEENVGWFLNEVRVATTVMDWRLRPSCDEKLRLLQLLARDLRR